MPWEHIGSTTVLGLEQLLRGVSVQAETENDSNGNWLEKNLRTKGFQVEREMLIQSGRQSINACERKRGGKIGIIACVEFPVGLVSHGDAER